MRSRATEPETTERLSADVRRELLLDVTKAIVKESGPAAVTMGTVADRAEVTRALVYKHFDNKDTLLAALYQREARALDRQIRHVVEAAPERFEPRLRAFVGAALDAVGEHAPFFTPLRSVGKSPETRGEQRRWDRRTSGYFASLAAEEFDIDERTAASAIAVLFTGIQSLLSQMRARPSAEQRRYLEDTYVEMSLGALTRLATHRSDCDLAPE